MNKLLIGILIAGSLAEVRGQLVSTNISDGLTPPSVAPGAPDGVKAISDMERVNLYSGSLSVSIPLLTIGGRGEAGYTMQAPVGSAPWTITMQTYCANGGESNCNSYGHALLATNKELFPFQAPYSPGIVYAKQVGLAPMLCGSPPTTVRYGQSDTHLVFEQPDGTQVVLSDGKLPSNPGCSGGGGLRGPRFFAMDESQIVFIAPDPSGIGDLSEPGEVDKFGVTGKLLFPNGVEYTVEGGKVMRITDRNGNYVSLTYGASGVYTTFLLATVTDSFGRTITITHDFDEGGGVRVDKIAYSGEGGKPRLIKVQRVGVSGTMPIRASHPAPSNFATGATQNNFDLLLKKITMADQRTYECEYTKFGELAKLKLPTGAAIEYDHAAGLSNAVSGVGTIAGAEENGMLLVQPNYTLSLVPGFKPAIYRRLIARRTYPNGSGTAETNTTYSRRETGAVPSPAPPQIGGGLVITSSGFVDVTTSGAGLASSEVTRHFHYENGDAPTDSYTPAQSMLGYPAWVQIPINANPFEGVEYQTEIPSIQKVTKGFVQAPGQVRALRNCQQSTLTGSSRAEKAITYDSYGNVSEVRDYALGVGPAVTTTGGIPTACAAPTATGVIRRVSKTYKTDYATDAIHMPSLVVSEKVYSGESTQIAQTDYEYDERGLLAVEGSTAAAGHDSAAYPATRKRGNVTALIKFSAAGATLKSALQYDLLGNVRRILPPHLTATLGGYSATTDLASNLNAAWLSYADNCTTSVGTGAVLGLVTGERLPPAVAGGTAYATATQYDCWLGVPTLFTDINGVQTKFEYEGTAPLSGLDKLKQTVRALGTSVASTTNYSYGTVLPAIEVTVKSDLRSGADNLLEKKSVFDGLGRATTDQVKNGSGWIYTHRIYDAANRVWKSSNPTSTGVCNAGTPCSFTETSYDAAGRPTTVIAPDGAKTTMVYSNNETTAVDPGLVSKRTVVDALGRLSEVVENPGGSQTVTKYHYDANGQLLTVCPDGGVLDSSSGVCSGSTRARSFTYDWLGRLRTATNPESGTQTYIYDETPVSANGAGQLTSRSQTRGVAAAEATYTAVTRYHYDQLGRMTSKVYAGEPSGFQTPGVVYSYDEPNPAIPNITSYSKGRLTRTETGNTIRAVSSYDPLGQVTRSMQKTLGTEYWFGTPEAPGYTYLKNGALASMRMPSGRVVSFGYDDLGRANRVESGGKEYVKSVIYEDHGGMKEIRKNGDVLREMFGYDPARLQLTWTTVAKCTDGAPCAVASYLLQLGYTYQTTASGGNGSGPNNNGNVFTQRIHIHGVFDIKQSYGYDAWNRLETFNEAPFAGGAATLNEKYCHDAHGNHAVESRAGVAAGVLVATPCTAAAVSAVFPQNRINLTPYDAAGGLAADHRSNMRYDAEDRLAKTWPLTPANAAATTYQYDADGRRVALNAPGGVTTTFVYDAFGKLTAEYGGVAGPGGVGYYTQDHLGSTRLVTDATGAPVRRFDYWPFGMEIFTSDTSYRTAGVGFGIGSSPTVRFTGKERDVETGLDYFGARYFSGAQGRFTSPDAPFADQHVGDPQSWNLYGYARNNPLRNVDVDGNAAVAIELLRNGQQTFNVPNPGSKLLGAVMIGVGATAAYATDAGFRSDVNTSVSAGVNAFLQAAPNTAYGDPGGLGPIAFDHPLMSQNANGSGNGGPAPSPQNSGPGNAAPNPGPEKPYKRPSNATTPEQRASVQGQPCATCGATGQKNYADHKDPLVQEYYRTGSVDRQRMRDPNSVRPQCANCSNQQGGWLSNFSKQMKRLVWGEGSSNE